MSLNYAPKVTLLENIEPKDGFNGSVYHVDPPVEYGGGTTSYVTTSYGLETRLGEGNTFAVFPSTAEGKFLEWVGIYQDCEGPDWCTSLM